MSRMHSPVDQTEDISRSLSVASGLFGLLQSVDRVLAVARDADRERVLRFCCDAQLRLLAVEPEILGPKLHSLPFLTESMSAMELSRLLEQSTNKVREAFSRTCINIDHAWSDAIAGLPLQVSLHALSPLQQ